MHNNFFFFYCFTAVFFLWLCVCIREKVFLGQKAQHDLQFRQQPKPPQSSTIPVSLAGPPCSMPPALLLLLFDFAFTKVLIPLFSISLSGPFMAFLSNQAGGTISLSYFFHTSVMITYDGIWIRMNYNPWAMTQGRALVPKAFFQKKRLSPLKLFQYAVSE